MEKCKPVVLDGGFIIFHTDKMQEGVFYNYIERNGIEYVARRRGKFVDIYELDEPQNGFEVD